MNDLNANECSVSVYPLLARVRQGQSSDTLRQPSENKFLARNSFHFFSLRMTQQTSKQARASCYKDRKIVLFCWNTRGANEVQSQAPLQRLSGSVGPSKVRFWGQRLEVCPKCFRILFSFLRYFLPSSVFFCQFSVDFIAPLPVCDYRLLVRYKSSDSLTQSQIA